jgi:DNA-binding PadR family transcriptional regulator
MPQVPSLTHLQFLVLGRLREGSATGRQVRDRLAQYSVRFFFAAFYQLMARMEDAGVVEGWYEQEVVEGQTIRQRHYKITAQGRTACDRSSKFYRLAGQDLVESEGLAYG